MWLSIMAISRFWSAACDALRAWSTAVEASLNESGASGKNALRRDGRLCTQPEVEMAGWADPGPHSASLFSPRNPLVDRQRIVRTARYVSLMSLRRILFELDRDHTLRQPTVVLVLAENIASPLPDLIRRSTWGRRLVLVVENGCAQHPSPVVVAELAAQEAALRWGQIIFEPAPEVAFVGALQSLDADEPLIVIWPEGMTEMLPLHILDRPCCLVTPL